MNQTIYPPSPKIDDYSFLDPTPSFKKQVRLTIAAIVLFIAVYILLIIGSIYLLQFCFKAAGAILSNVIGFWPLLISIGLICLAIMVFIFMFKFIFKVKKMDTSGSKEIMRKEHPQLFSFIDELTTELKAPKPKKIFLIPEVNASVFYDSSFWSMFLPVRKNLNIGLGLINCLNMSEFKAVLAHEFGHFSQRSMKLGSYVYTVNHVIYDLVYSYDRWDRTLQDWANAGGIFGLFAVLTFRIAELVRKLFRFFYNIINKQNMKLSREMEYNADLVAVSATGKEAMISSLRRIIFGDGAYQIVINYLNKLIKQNKVPENFYQLHSATIKKLAEENELYLSNGLPIINNEDIDKNQLKSRVVFKDQWASHPDQKDREKNINGVDINGIVSEDSPWALFNNPTDLQKEITKTMYRNVDIKEEVQPLESRELLSIIQKDKDKTVMPKAYKGFYDNRFLLDFQWEKAIGKCEKNEFNFDDVFSDNSPNKFKQFLANTQDIEILTQIKNKQIETQSFDFDGIKYKASQIDEVLKKLENEIKEQHKSLIKLEEYSFCFHYIQAVKKGLKDEFLNKYKTYEIVAVDNIIYGELHAKTEYYFTFLQNNPQLSNAQAEFLFGELLTIRNKVKQKYQASEKINLPAAIKGRPAATNWPNYLIPDKNLFFDREIMDGNSFMNFYEGITGMYLKVNETMIDAYSEFIWFQSELID